MALSTAFTRLLSVRHPIVLAPMGGSAGGDLAAAVSEAGGLGLVGGGRENQEWLDRELETVAAGTAKPWGVGFQSWSAALEALVDPSVTKAIIESSGEDTERSTILDIARGCPVAVALPSSHASAPVHRPVARPGRAAGCR